MERKTSGFELKRIDAKGEFVARIARLNKIDLDSDVTLRGAFGNSQVAPVLIGHQWSMIPLGKAAIREEGDEVLAYGKLNTAMDAGRALYEALRFDASTPPPESEFSYGFVIEDSEPGVFEGKRVRYLKKLRVLEVSVVVAGAGDTALLAVKSDTAQRDYSDGAFDDLYAVAGAARATIESVCERLPFVDRETLAQATARLQHLSVIAAGLIAEKFEEKRATEAQAFRYRFVVPPIEDPRRQAAVAYLKMAAEELGTPEPYLRFFTEAKPGEQVDFSFDRPVIGMANFAEHPNLIIVHEKLAPRQMLEVIGHETLHNARPGASEATAEEFGRNFAAKYGAALWPVPRPTDYLAAAMFFTNLGRLRGWSESELHSVLAQIG